MNVNLPIHVVQTQTALMHQEDLIHVRAKMDTMEIHESIALVRQLRIERVLVLLLTSYIPNESR
jgi:hypothetical protein